MTDATPCAIPPCRSTVPLIEVVADTDSDEEVQFRARKLIADARLQGFLMAAVVKGLRATP